MLAVEGEKTEPRYFADLVDDEVIDEATHVEVLAPDPGRHDSSPGHALARLADLRARYQLLESDQLWLVLDVDRWGSATLAEVCREALGRGWQLGLSNPAFEVWLQLHFTTEPDGHKKTMKAALAQLRAACDSSERPWGYDRVVEAVRRAAALHADDGPSCRWPPTPPGTYVYKLMQQLLRLE